MPKMRNAKTELEEVLRDYKRRSGAYFHIVCANIYTDNFRAQLKMDFSTEDYENFMDSLDFEYNAGLGTQNLFGIVWGMENLWLERGTYDGREWWEVCGYPTIPEHFYPPAFESAQKNFLKELVTLRNFELGK